MNILRTLRVGQAGCVLALAMGCNSGTSSPPVDSGTNDAAVDSGTRDAAVDSGTHDAAVDAGTHDAAVDSGTHDAAVDSGTAKVTAVDCATVTPSQDIAWFLGVSPVSVTVSAGQVVQWHVTDTLPHTVTSGTLPTPDGLFTTPITMAAPKCFRFDVVGDYPFFCEIHAATATPMTGTVNVQ